MPRRGSKGPGGLVAETGLVRDKSLSIALGCTVASYTRGQAAQFAFTVAIAKVWVWVEAVAWVGVPALIALSLVQALARARLHNDTTTQRHNDAQRAR